MSFTVRVGLGDTWETIARRVYGAANRAYLLQAGNPGLIDPLPFQAVVEVPEDPYGPQILPQRDPSATASTFNVSIGGKKLVRWDSMSVTRSMDAFRTFQVRAPWDKDDKQARKMFRPFGYPKALVSVNGPLLLTGAMISATPSAALNDKTIILSGYSKPGILQDCTVPISACPLNFKNQKLDAIATKIAGLFGVGVVFKDDPGRAFDLVSLSAQEQKKESARRAQGFTFEDTASKAVNKGPDFNRVAMDPTENPLDFLHDLARRRGFLVTDDEFGRMVFYKEGTAGKPVTKLLEGTVPLENIAVNFDPSVGFSSVTGWRPGTTRLKGGSYTVRNPFLSGASRPYTFRADASDGATIKQMVEATTGRMWPAMVSWTARVTAAQYQIERYYSPGDVVTVYAPEAMVYNEYDLRIREVTIERGIDTETAELTLILPGVFSGTLPARMPWD